MWLFLAVLVVASYVATAFTPKTPKQKPQEAERPDVEEGKPVVKVYGTVWIDDAQVLGFKRIRKDAIRESGGKK